MSIALDSNTSNRIHGMSCFGIYESADSTRLVGDRRFSGSNGGVPDAAAAAARMKGEAKLRVDEGDSCSSSSIGNNSDSSGAGDEEESGEGEVQSSFKGALDSLDSLEDVLPIKRGISTFYSGKSKSFTSLSDAASYASIKDIAKPDDSYTRKRKNLLAHGIFWDKNGNHLSKSNSGGISKRPANFSRSTLALGVTMGRADNNSSSDSATNSCSSSPSSRLPPLPPNGRKSPNNEPLLSPPRGKFPTWRSFSLSDLQQASVKTATPSISGVVVNKGDNDDFH